MKMKLLAVILLVSAAGARATILDDFNRPNALTLGSNWTVQANGGGEILNNRARARNAATTENLVTYNGVSSNSAFVDVFTVDSSVAYIALDLAFKDVANNYFIKVQNDGLPSGFNHVAFYYGNNGSGSFFPLITPFNSGRITASYVGTTATLKIEDGGAGQSYTHTYAGATGGTGIGLGFYGTAQADNFGIPSVAAPEPASVLLLGIGVSALAGAVRRRKK